MELRSPPSGAPAPLESVLCTYALNRRQSRPPDYQGENRALADLAAALAESPRTVLRKLVEAALELCQAGSAGISLLSQVDEGRSFHWPAVAGAWKRQAGREALREALPCGLVLDRNAPQLFAQPALHYRDLSGIKPPIEEALVTPFYVNRRVVGTIWVFTHDPARKLDPEDMRILGTLGKFAADAYHLLESVGALQEGAVRRERSAPRPATAAAAASKQAQDIERKQVEGERRKSEEMSRSLERAGMLAHELRNSLAAIRDAAQILRVKGDEDVTLQSASEVLDHEVEQMVRLVDDLLKNVGGEAAPAAIHRRILVVDDNRDSADSLAMLLKLGGHEVHAAFDGLAALAAAAELRPDVILIDLALPKLSGYEVARRIRETQGAKPVLVALTGLDQEEDRRRSEEAGFNVHLVKPVDLATLEGFLEAPSAG